MNWDEFAFANQQLAGMLKSGISLEGALRQVCASMRRGELRTELELLEGDLAKGVPLKDALSARQLPAFYVSMIRAGAQSGDLPGVLLIVADYYARLNTLWTRLKGLLVYPAIVLGCLTIVTAYFSIQFQQWFDDIYWETSLTIYMWIVPSLFLLGIALILLCVMTPSIRRWMQWFIPGLHESNLYSVASMLAIQLQSGTSLRESLDFVRQCEAASPAGKDLARWQHRLAAGESDLRTVASGSKSFPPLFIWLGASAGEDLAKGFSRAADIYYRRALYRRDVFLFVAAPVLILATGCLVALHGGLVIQLFRVMADKIGDSGP